MKKGQLLSQLPKGRKHLSVFAEAMSQSSSPADQGIAHMLCDESIEHHHYGEKSVDVFHDNTAETVTMISGEDDSCKTWSKMSKSDYKSFIQGAASQMGMSA